jgi:hypothetical protein
MAYEGLLFPILTEEEKQIAFDWIKADKSYLANINAAKHILTTRHKNEIDYLYNAIVLERIKAEK